jgi:asparagine synthase (glutamine-hydrolysing)
VPVGVSLSGGIDSSAVAAFAARRGGADLQAFSVGYPGYPECDERRMASAFAEGIGLKFNSIELRTDEFVGGFEEMVYSMDDPIADIAAYGYSSVARLARENGVPVLLSGTGGDELFWGYGWVRDSVERNILKQRILEGEAGIGLKHLFDAFNATSKKKMITDPVGAMRDLLDIARHEKGKFYENPDRFIFYDDTMNFSSAPGFLSELATEGFKGSASEEKVFSFFTDAGREDIPIKVCRFLMETWLFSNCVALGDRLSMAHGVELRLPFLDMGLVELVTGLRKTHFGDFRLGYKKWFIDAMKGVLPDDVLTREKRGFTPPCEEWFKAIVKRFGNMCDEGGMLSSLGIMRPKAMESFIEAASLDKTDTRRLFFAYKMILLEVWLRRFFGGGHA